MIIVYIQFIDWFFIYINLYLVSFHLNYCRLYVIGYFTRSDLSVCLWNDHYHYSSSFIWFCIWLNLFLFIWIIVAGILFDFLQEVISLYVCETIIIIYPVYWLIYYLLRSAYCFLSEGKCNVDFQTCIVNNIAYFQHISQFSYKIYQHI